MKLSSFVTRERDRFDHQVRNIVVKPVGKRGLILSKAHYALATSQFELIRKKHMAVFRLSVIV